MTDMSRLLAQSRTSPDAMPSRRMVIPGEDSVFFGGGLPDPIRHPTDELAALFTQLLSTRDKPSLAYSYGRGDPELRTQIAARATARGLVDVAASQIVVTSGSSGALALTALALIEPGDVVLCEEYTYPAALATFRQLGARVAPVPIDREGIRTDQLHEIVDRLVRDGARPKLLYTIATCHSPTGSTLPLERRQQLVEVADRHDLALVQDATYADVRFTDIRLPELLELAPHRTIHAGSFSKTIAPGLRLGWAVAPPAIADVMQQIRTDLGTSALLQRVVARYLSGGGFDAHLVESNLHHRSKRDLLVDALTASCRDVAEWDVPDGGFFVWLRLRDVDAVAVSAAAERHGVGFLGAGHFAAGEGRTDAIRLAYGEVPAEQVVEGVARLRRAIDAAAQTDGGTARG